MKRIISVLILAIALAASLSGASIGRINDNPRKYVGMKVRIRGEVTEILEIPFTDFSLLVVEDKSGTIAVLSETDSAVGARFKARIQVYGIDTESTEYGGISFVDAFEEFLVDNDLAEQDSAGRLSRNIANALTWLLRQLDTSMVGLSV